MFSFMLPIYIRLITRVRVEYGELFHKEHKYLYFHELKASIKTACE